MSSPQPTGPQSGFLIVKTFEALYRAYERPTLRHVDLYSVPREGVEPDAAPKKYRGIYRDPLRGLPPGRSGLPGRHSWVYRRPAGERAACLAIGYLEGQGRSADDLLFSLAHAVDVHRLVGEPEQREVIWVARSEARLNPPPYTQLLGFEPSYFYPDHFSAVCDCLCFPRWHGTDAEARCSRTTTPA